MAIYWGGVRFLVRRPVTELALGRAAPHVALGVVIGLLLFGVILGVLAATGTYSLHASGRGWRSLVGPAIVAAAVAGVFEELVMRGALLQLVERFAGSWAGLLFGAAFLYTRNLWLAMGAHVAFDAAEKLLGTPGETPGLLHFGSHGSDVLTGGAAGLEASVVTVVACVAVSSALLAGAAARGHIVPPRRRSRPAPEVTPA